MKPVVAEICIYAPAGKVWDIITDFDRYPVWNTFTPRITLATSGFTVGAEFDLDCRMNGRRLLKDEREVILSVEPDNYRFAMGTSRTRGRPGIRSFRWQTCEPMSGGRTRFINSEEFHGPLAPLVYALYARQLRAAFKRYCLDLKEYAELR
ncbi:MAG: SRPBCC domain-containing protein [Spirochaetes bacterium]|nr:SRPBCC domain-containing protein [Spirochaetota bacterium]